MKSKIRVLIVDDSSVVRSLLTHILSSDPGIEVVGVASDPYIAREKLVSLKPDVMTLDIEMPRMDGITFLEKVMKHFPIPTIIVSSLSVRGSETAYRALEVGAVDVVAKPAIDVTKALNQIGQHLIETVKAAARVDMNKHKVVRSEQVVASRPTGSSTALIRTTHQVLAIASSTGGTEALKVVLPRLPADLPGTVVVQHMPPVFTKTFAEHLQKLCPFEVKEAQDGDRVNPGRVLIAPGNYHMELSRSGAYYYVHLHQQPQLHGVRPAADYLMWSVAKVAGANAIGVVLTGMGKDGADGLLKMKEAGAYNIAQDEKSCIVFGMPKEAIDLGAIHKTLPLDKISDELRIQFSKREVA
ncbi:MAG: chemotaxis response regulator protein-glutamate methylesterase 2 [Oligoflexia bacterium]|nr:MAG: chemotaxis response regulator protein-glutamate methylesterase 2 [Oligoflexia bacterium]